MKNEHENKEIIASKRLSSLKMVISNQYYRINVIWCRTVYAYNEVIQTKSHNHSFYEIHYVLTGACSLLLNEKQVDLYKSEYIIISPKKTHQFIDATKDFSKLVFGFEVIDDNGKIVEAIEKTNNNEKKCGTEIIEDIIAIILKTALYKGEHVDVLIRNLVQSLLIEFARINDINIFYEKIKIKEKDRRIEIAERFMIT